MRIIIVIFIALYFFNCHSSYQSSVPVVEIKNVTFQKFLNTYIQVLATKRDVKKFVTVNVEFYTDTVSIGLINSLPDDHLTKINGITNYKDFQIYIVGASHVDSLYEITKHKVFYNKQAFLNDTAGDFANLIHIEPLFWKLYFVNNKLVNYFPKDSIEKYINVDTPL